MDVVGSNPIVSAKKGGNMKELILFALFLRKNGKYNGSDTTLIYEVSEFTGRTFDEVSSVVNECLLGA